MKTKQSTKKEAAKLNKFSVHLFGDCLLNLWTKAREHEKKKHDFDIFTGHKQNFVSIRTPLNCSCMTLPHGKQEFNSETLKLDHKSLSLGFIFSVSLQSTNSEVAKTDLT